MCGLRQASTHCHLTCSTLWQMSLDMTVRWVAAVYTLASLMLSCWQPSCHTWEMRRNQTIVKVRAQEAITDVIVSVETRFQRVYVKKSNDGSLNYVHPLLKIAGVCCGELCKCSDESYISCSVCRRNTETCIHFTLVDQAVFVVWVLWSHRTTRQSCLTHNLHL